MIHAARGALQFADQVVERRGTTRAFSGETLDGVGAEIGNDQFVAAAHQAARHVGAHAPETYHSELHSCSLEMSVDLVQATEACCTSSANFVSPAFTSLPRCTRSARRLRSAST